MVFWIGRTSATPSSPLPVSFAPLVRRHLASRSPGAAPWRRTPRRRPEQREVEEDRSWCLKSTVLSHRRHVLCAFFLFVVASVSRLGALPTDERQRETSTTSEGAAELP